ncbi:MAG TPA: uroporphyrinogen decarboxylase family protein [Actinomycetota bacterium]
MEPADRIRAAVALEPTDRPPAAWWGHTYREEWSAPDLARVTARRQREFGWDVVKLQPRACCFAQAFGSEYRPAMEFRDAPALVRPAVLRVEDWDRVTAAEAPVPSLIEQNDALRAVIGELGPGVPVIQTVFSPLTVAGYLAGEDRARTAAELRERPDLVGPALARIAHDLASFAASAVDAGAAGIFFAVSGFASVDLMSVDDYRRLVLPYDRRVLDAVAGAWLNVLHLCGPRLSFELADDLPSHVVSWSSHQPGNPALADGRSLAGRAVMGGLDHEGALVRGTPAEVRAERDAAIEAAGGVGLVVAPGCSVPPEAPEENLREVTGAGTGTSSPA